MSGHKATIILLTLVLASSSSFAQNISNYYAPYGFQLPNLKAGQYLVSLWGNYEDFKYNRKTDHNYEIDRLTTINSNMAARGVLAITDCLLVSSLLEFYPRRFVSEQLRSTLLYATAKTTELQYSSFRPSLSVVVKPRPDLEIYGEYAYSYYEYDLRDYADFYSPDYTLRPFWQKSRRVSIGVNWLGEL